MNPYSYILNNPLAGTDPTGYEVCATAKRCEISINEIESVAWDKKGNVYVTNGDGEAFKISKSDRATAVGGFLISNGFSRSSVTGSRSQGVTDPAKILGPQEREKSQFALMLSGPEPRRHGDALSGLIYAVGDTVGLAGPLGLFDAQAEADIAAFDREYGLASMLSALRNPRKIIGNIKESSESFLKKIGRSGDQQRLRDIVADPKASSADRGWIRQEMNSIERGQRDTIRRPPGRVLAHERGREAAKGYSYEHSNLQDVDLHRTQHRYDDWGRRNRERPLESPE